MIDPDLMALVEEDEEIEKELNTVKPSMTKEEMEALALSEYILEV